MNKKKILLYTLITIALASIVIAQDVTKEADWADLFGSLGSIGFYFSTIVNYIIYGWYWIIYWLLVVLFFTLVGVLIFWLPLKLYPTFIQYYNFFQRIFGLTPRGPL